MAEYTLVEAVRMALSRAMDDDPSVVLFGEDIGINGGVFRATDGLAQRFGGARVRDTPLSEALIGRHGCGCGGIRIEACGRNTVHRLHLSGNRSTGQSCLANAKPHARQVVMSDGAARALWRRHSCSRTPFRER